MGCFDSKEEGVFNPRLARDQTNWVDTPVGKLVLRIKNLYLQKLQNRQVKKAELLLKIRLSNQDEQLNLEALDKNIQQNKKFAFAINSCYKCYGRFLLIQLWNLKGNKEKDTGLGFINLQDLICIHKTDQQHFKKVIKSYINYSNEPGGYIQFQAEFTPYHYEDLTIKINSSFLESHVEGKTFAAKVIIGEEVLETKPVKANEKNLIVWKDQKLQFRVPTFLQFGRLQIIQKKGSSDVFWGEYSLDLKYYLQEKRQIEINGELENQHEISGRIKLSSKKGTKNLINFFQIDSPKRKINKYETSIKLIEDPSMTDKNDENTKEGMPETEPVISCFTKKERATSLPPLDINEALKKLQIKRKQKAKDL